MGTHRLPNGEFDTEHKNPPTQARFPCLKNFWKMNDEQTGAGSVSGNLRAVIDSVGGNDITSLLEPNGLLFTAGDGIKMPMFGGVEECLVPFSFENKNTVMMWLCTRGAGYEFSVGGMKVKNNDNSFDDSVNTPNKDTALIGTGTDEMTVLSLDLSKAGATGVAVEKVDAAGTTIVTLVKSGVSADVDMSLYTGTNFKASAVTNIYGITVFQFTDMPTPEEVELAALWMRERWLTGEKVIYPAWLGRD